MGLYLRVRSTVGCTWWSNCCSPNCPAENSIAPERCSCSRSVAFVDSIIFQVLISPLIGLWLSGSQESQVNRAPCLERLYRPGETVPPERNSRAPSGLRIDEMVAGIIER